MSQRVVQLKKRLCSVSDVEKAKFLSKFGKTNKEEYAEGDQFIGIVVPLLRKISKEYLDLSFPEIEEFFTDKIHEFRFLALLVLISQYEKTKDNFKKKEIFNFYLKNIEYVNHWDLVDLSSHKIVGAYIFDNRSKINILYQLANKGELWQERISIVSNLYFVKRNEFDILLELSKKFLTHSHHLIHKAVGWMLREVGKKDESVLEDFLKQNASQMPRTMLRYSIEKFPKEVRDRYMKQN